MKKEKIILQLSVEIDTLKAHIQRLKRDNYKLHQLDVELLQQKTRQLYDMLFELEGAVETQSIAYPHSKSIASPHSNSIADEVKETILPKEEVTEKPEAKVTAPPAFAENPEEKIAEKEIEEVVEEEANKIEIVLDIKKPKEIIEELQPTPEPIKEETPTKIETVKQEDTKSNFDLFSESGTATVSDKFTGSDKQSLADKMQESRVNDLRQSIGINEKFLFINELFNGDMGRYNKAIDELNELKTLKGAEIFLLELKVQNQWDSELDAFLKLKDLTERKFK